ncbi:hypothetical protein QBZ16_002737 [Prototheca wickerhamii]|uniref:Uncharacterized protein n=1 Tax=Prototheca wickerhamii TaxID=3111 RepID=A0AAD9IN59_PROWI|nr:hypothetical protein QBZ16_002737 [Prototheca wickerhamii]
MEGGKEQPGGADQAVEAGPRAAAAVEARGGYGRGGDGRPTTFGRGGGGRDYAGEKRGGGGGYGGDADRPSNPRGQVANAGEVVSLDSLPAPPSASEMAEVVYTASAVDRPAPGTAGERYPVLANWFPVKVSRDEFYQYHRWPRALERALELMGVQLMQEVARQLRWRPGCWAYDGRRVLYSTESALPGAGAGAEAEAEMNVEGTPRRYAVSLRRVSVIRMDEVETFMRSRFRVDESPTLLYALHALNMVLRQGAHVRPGALVRPEAVLFRPSAPTPIPGGGEVWFGYRQSVRPCLTGLALNLDRAVTVVLREQPLIELCEEVLGGPMSGPLSPVQRRRLLGRLRGLKVATTHMRSVRRIKDLSQGSAFSETFERDGKQVTVAAYMEEQYDVQLRRRDLPCVCVGSAGGTLLPMELLRVAPKQRLQRPSEEQRSALLRAATQRPEVRAAHILDCVAAQTQPGGDPTLREFGVEVSGQMTRVDARVLPAPALVGGRGARLEPARTGTWFCRQGLETPATIASWAVVCLADKSLAAADLEATESRHGPTFLGDLLKALRNNGITTPKELPPVHYASRAASPYDALVKGREAARTRYGADPAIIIVVLPGLLSQLYRAVKQAGDSIAGVVTQCVVAPRAGIGRPPRGRDAYCGNLARLPVLDAGRPFMLLGADVTHPTGSGGASVAAVVASMDATGTRYATRVSMQHGRVEIIRDLRGMVKSLLLDFYRATNGLKPERIVFFRDGVAEDMLADVYKKEYSALREACAEMADDQYRPPITLCIVRKRHHTRLFAPPGDRRVDRSGNVPPGVVVDTDIIQPHQFSFYLVSHSGLLGTSRPALYTVLVDENGFTADGIQKLSYHLAYLYCRCSRAISFAAPAMYAHLAASRGRIMLRGGDGSEDGSVMDGGNNSNLQFMSINPVLSKRMFFV